MLAIHELGETVIGDLTQFQISRDEKEKIEHQAVHKILSELIDGKQIEELFLEFDAHESKEAQFAYQCDKLDVICNANCMMSKIVWICIINPIMIQFMINKYKNYSKMEQPGQRCG